VTVKELIEQLSLLPQDYIVSYDGGDYQDDFREVERVEVSHFSTLGTPRGVYIK
jgi:hypothetical protein